jgi:uncharacterized protein
MESGRSVLIIPGLGDSGPQHWQSLWEASHPEYWRIQQNEWDHPRCSDWTQNIDTAITAAESPVVLVAHSMGCIATAHWAISNGANGRVAAALLVAPPDVATLDRAKAFAAAWGSELVILESAGHINAASCHGPWLEGERLLDKLMSWSLATTSPI